MRKATALFFVLFLALGVDIASAQSRDIDGTWDVSWDTPQGTRHITLTLHRQGMTVTVTAQLPMRGADDRTREVAITDGAIDEDHLTFSIPMGGPQARGGMGGTGGELQFNAVVGLRGVMGGFLTGEEMIEGVVTGAEASPRTEVPFTALPR